MGANLTTYQLNAASVTARNAEFADTPLTDIPGDGSYDDPYLGVNRAGSCAPGIGICTNVPNPKDSDWTLEDQDENARAPQNSQHIGGDGLGDGDQSVNPINGIVDQNGTADFNDEMAFVEADVASAAPGVEFDTVSGAVNRGEQTILIGDLAWGAIPVA